MSPTFTRADVESAARAKAARAGVPPRKVRSALPTPKEREIQAAILAYLKLLPGVVAWRNNTGAMFGEHKGKRWAVRFGHPGLSDIIGWVRTTAMAMSIWPGPPGGDFPPYGEASRVVARFLAIEVKREKTWPTEAQTLFLASVQQAGGIAIVARSVEDVRRVLAPR